MTTANRVFSLFSFIGLVFCCVPFRRHMQGDEFTLRHVSYKLMLRISLECRDMSQHGLDSPSLSELLHQLPHLEWQSQWSGASLVRHKYVDCSFLATGFTQISASRVHLASVIAVPVAVLCTIRRIYLVTVGQVPMTAAEVDFISDGSSTPHLTVLYPETPCCDARLGFRTWNSSDRHYSMYASCWCEFPNYIKECS
jgi:hypothetical protein